MMHICLSIAGGLCTLHTRQRSPLTPAVPVPPAPTQVPRLRTVVLGMGLLPASLPPTVERLGVVGQPSEEALAQAYTGLQALLPQVRWGGAGRGGCTGGLLSPLRARPRLLGCCSRALACNPIRT